MTESTQERLARRILQSLKVFENLTPEAFTDLLHQLQVERLPAGRQLFARGQRDHWVFFMVQGELELEWGDGGREVLHAGDAATHYPLADQQPRPATATTRTPVLFVRFHNTLMEVLIHQLDSEQYQVEEIVEDDAQPRNRLLSAIYHDYMRDRLALPHLPDVALKIHRAVQDPECDVEVITRIIRSDPALAVKLIKAANSALYNVPTPIRSIHGAVVYLGLPTTRELVTTLALRELFKVDSKRLQRRMRELWEHSAMVASVSYVLGQMTPGINPERALLLGLLHDIGKLPLISYAAAFAELADSEAQLDEAIAALRGPVGAMILRKWEFGDETVAVALEAEHWQRDPDPRADYADVVLVAQLICDEHREVRALLGQGVVPAYRKIARGMLDEQWREDLLREARRDVAETLILMR